MKKYQKSKTLPQSVKYHIKRDHEAIIDVATWEAVQAEIERRAQYCKDHFTNAYSQKTETNPFYIHIYKAIPDRYHWIDLCRLNGILFHAYQ